MAKTGRNLMLVVAAVVAVGWYVDQDTAAGAPADHGPARYVKPVAGLASSGFGPRAGGFHYGLDIAAPLGTPIRAVTRGEVIEAGPASGFGYWVRIQHPDGTVTVYGHMRVITQPAGAHVRAGQVIAKVGSEGQSTGPHCHFEVWPYGNRAERVDPAPWLANHGIRY